MQTKMGRSSNFYKDDVTLLPMVRSLVVDICNETLKLFRFYIASKNIHCCTIYPLMLVCLLVNMTSVSLSTSDNDKPEYFVSWMKR